MVMFLGGGLFGNGSADTVTRHLGVGTKATGYWKSKYQSPQLSHTNNYNSHAT